MNRCSRWWGFVMLGAVGALAACGGDDASTPDADVSVTPDAAAEVTGDVGPDSVTPDVSADVDAADSPDTSGPTFPARALPFVFTRQPAGEPIPAAEVTAFTEQFTGVLKDVGYFRWLLRTSTGVDASTGLDDYLAWHNDVLAVKAGNTVTFQHRGGEHNMWIPSSKILAAVASGYRLTGDWEMGKLTEGYCKGLSAVVKGFVWDADDPAPYLMARSVFPLDHAFTLDAARWQDDGRGKVVEYHHMNKIEDGWNAHTFPWPHNPTWGAMWVTNMRSKDDVCAIVRTTTWLPYVVADAKDESVRAACAETLELMQGFNRDIVDHDYEIRTKDPDGTARLVTEQDLGSYNWYSGVDPLAECPARLASDLIAYGEPRTGDCGSGEGDAFDLLSPTVHYYNYPIVWDYHMAALGNALAYGYNDAALALLGGLRDRMDRYLAPDTAEPGVTNGEWKSDMAVLLVKAASMGLPLTATEARHVQAHFAQAAVEFAAWPRWDLWDAAVPDGEYASNDGFRPRGSHEAVSVDAFPLLLEACASPFLNPDGAAFVDCAVVADLARWGGD
jgi:hypothetical protein